MATDGMVTVIEGDEVRLKIIAGTDGDKAPIVAEMIRRLGRVPSLEEAYRLAAGAPMGTPECLVVVNETSSYDRSGGDLPKVYRETFHRPRFNPRWHYGSAEFIEVVNL